MRINGARVEPIYWIMVVMSVLLYGVDYLIFGRGGEIGVNATLLLI